MRLPKQSRNVDRGYSASRMREATGLAPQNCPCGIFEAPEFQTACMCGGIETMCVEGLWVPTGSSCPQDQCPCAG
jgi:hypothetical protein